MIGSILGGATTGPSVRLLTSPGSAGLSGPAQGCAAQSSFAGKTNAPSYSYARGGSLPADLYDRFGLLMKLPDTPGKTLWLTVIQTCENGRREWTEIPADGTFWHDLHSPAPFIRLQAGSH